MQRLEVSGTVRPLHGSLGVKGLISLTVLIIYNNYSYLMCPTYAEILLQVSRFHFGHL